MIRCRVLLILLSVVTLFGAAAAYAEEQPRFYISVYGGYRFGTSFDVRYTGGPDYDTPLNIPGGGELGLAFDYRLTRTLLLEASYDRQSSKLRLDEQELTDLGVELWQAGLHYEFLKPEDYEIDGYMLFTLGATRLVAENDSETRFSGAVAIGTKAFFTDTVGARIQGRFSVTSVGDGAAFCALSNNCYVPPDWVWLYLGDITAGIVIRL